MQRKRWFYLSAGTLLLMCLGVIYAWPVFRQPLVAEFGWSTAEASLTFSISMMMFCLGGLLGGLLNQRLGSRRIILLSAVLLGGGLAASSQVTSLSGLYLSYGMIGGLGSGLGYNAVISLLVRWFPDRQGLVSGISMMGFGMGSMVLGTLAAAMIGAAGWRWTLTALGAVFMVLLAAGMVVLRPVRPADLAVMQQDQASLRPAREELTAQEMFHRKHFWLYFGWAVLLSAGGLAIINGSVAYASTFVGGDLTAAAMLAGLVSVTGGIGRIAVGQCFDKWGWQRTMCVVCGCYAIAGALLLASLFSGSLLLVAAAFSFTGLAYGGVPPTSSAYTASFFGRRHYALNFSLMNLSIIPASYLGPLCGTVSDAFAFGLLLVFALIGLLLLHGIARQQQILSAA